MKKTEIAAKVFELMDQVPLREVEGGELVAPIKDLAGLSLVPWFCDVSVQWAFRISMPGKALGKSLLKKVPNSFLTVTEAGAVLIGVPGDGIEPSTYTLAPLAESIANAAQSGMALELAAANLGVVKRDWDAKAETASTCGNQRYAGTVDADGNWAIRQSTLAVNRAVLDVALDCGRRVVNNGPWKVKDKPEAYSVVMHWLRSPQANVNPLAVKQFIALRDGEFTNSDPGMVRKLCGLGLGFFRERLAGGPFQWEDSAPVLSSPEQLEEVARAVVG